MHHDDASSDASFALNNTVVMEDIVLICVTFFCNPAHVVRAESLFLSQTGPSNGLFSGLEVFQIGFMEEHEPVYLVS